MDGIKGLPPFAEVQEAEPPGGVWGKAPTFFLQAIALEIPHDSLVTREKDG